MIRLWNWKATAHGLSRPTAIWAAWRGCPVGSTTGSHRLPAAAPRQTCPLHPGPGSLPHFPIRPNASASGPVNPRSAPPAARSPPGRSPSPRSIGLLGNGPAGSVAHNPEGNPGSGGRGRPPAIGGGTFLPDPRLDGRSDRPGYTIRKPTDPESVPPGIGRRGPGGRLRRVPASGGRRRGRARSPSASRWDPPAPASRARFRRARSPRGEGRSWTRTAQWASASGREPPRSARALGVRLAKPHMQPLCLSALPSAIGETIPFAPCGFLHNGIRFLLQAHW